MNNKEEKSVLYKPRLWRLLGNGECLGIYESRRKVKYAQHVAMKEAAQDMLDIEYTIEKIN